MEQTKKRYHLDVNPKTPLSLGVINLFQISDLACASDYEVRLHRQHCIEITYIVEGEGIFRCNDQEWHVREGQLHLTAADDIHYIKSSKEAPLHYICFGFTFNKAHGEFGRFATVAEFFEAPKERLAQDLYNTYELLSGALSELSRPRFLSEEMLSTFLLQTIISTYRSFHKERVALPLELSEQNSLNPLVYEMTRYIERNVTEMPSLSAMAAELGYNYSYLSRLFSAAMGTSLKQYYDQRRFERAVEMLGKDKSLSQIAEKLGFADAAAFCKAFKRYYNVSPGRYRANLR